MTESVDAVFKHEIDREDSVDAMLGSGYGDLIDILEENTKVSIFDTEEGVI